MARVTQFSEKSLERCSVHQEVDATYSVYEVDGETFLQIDTYGRGDRQIVGKVSQTLQLDRQGRHELRRLLELLD